MKPQAVFKTRRGSRKPGRPQFLHGSASIILIFTSQFEPAPTAYAMVYDAQPEIAGTSGDKWWPRAVILASTFTVRLALSAALDRRVEDISARCGPLRFQYASCRFMSCSCISRA